MDGEDYQMGVALLNDLIRDQIRAAGNRVDNLNLPEIIVADRQSRELVVQLATTIKVIGIKLNQEQDLNNHINGYAPMASKESFAEIVKGVFDDGQINWGRIVVLFYIVGKLSVKMVRNNPPSVVLDLVNLCLDYFKTNLLAWIRSMGGWISSISGLTQFSLEEFSSSSLCRISPSANAVLTFMAGVLIGGLIAWKMNKNS